jgi:hypothetical protein
MRLLAFLLIAAGIFGLAKGPEILSGMTSSEVAKIVVFDRGNGGWLGGWSPGKTSLDPADNPHRITVEAAFLPSANPLRNTAGLTVSIASRGETILEGGFDLPLPQNASLGGNDRVTQIVTPQFDVSARGDYTISVLPEEAQDFEVSRVTVTIGGRFAKPDDRLRLPSYAAIGLGVLMLLFSGRRRRGAPVGDEQTKPEPQRRWGRDGTG